MWNCLIMNGQPTPSVTQPPQNIRFNKGNQWLICPDHKALFLEGGRLTSHNLRRCFTGFEHCDCEELLGWGSARTAKVDAVKNSLLFSRKQTKELLLSSHKNVPSFLPPKLGFVEGLKKSHFAPRWLGNHIKCHDFFPTTFISKSEEKDWIRKRHLVFLHMFPNCLTLRSQEYPIGGISPILFWGWDWNPQSYSGDGIGFLGEVISKSCSSSTFSRGDFIWFSEEHLSKGKENGLLGMNTSCKYI